MFRAVAATRLKNTSQRRARFHSSDDRSFVYITISAVELRERREKEDIHLPVAFDVDVPARGRTDGREGDRRPRTLSSSPLLCKGTVAISPAGRERDGK